MQHARTLDLVSMYLSEPVLKAHTISLQLKEHKAGHMEGKTTLDPNTCSLDSWGDRRGCTKMMPRTLHVEAILMRTLDPHGHHRVHWALHLEGMPNSRLSLVEYPAAHLWYLSVPTDGDGTSVVPLFDAKLFAFDPAGTIQTRYGVPMRDVMKRGDAAEMKAEVETVRHALAELDAHPDLARSRNVAAAHVSEVRAALKELEDALANVKE